MTTLTTQLGRPSARPVTAVRLDQDFHDFYRDEADGLYRALALALGDADLAQEAVNEGMARAYQRWGKIERYDNPAGWVYRVGLNWGRSRLRKMTNEVLTTSMQPGEVVHHIDPDLQEALARLSIDARAVVVLRYLLGWSTADTAAALKIAEGTVKSRLARSLADLETMLEER